MRIEPHSTPATTPPRTPQTAPPPQARGTTASDTVERAPASTGPFSPPDGPRPPAFLPPRPGELVNPAIASQPLGVIREVIRRAATREAIPPDMHHLPLEDRADMYTAATQAGVADVIHLPGTR